MSTHRRSVVAGLLVLLCATAFTPANAGVKARAFAMRAKLDKYGVSDHVDCDSGWLDGSRGGSRSNRGSVSNGNVLHVDHMESESHGDDCKGASRSSLEAGWILKGTPLEVTWTHIETADEDTCCRAVDVDYRPATIQGLTFGGRPVIVTGQANQTLVVPGAVLVINERKSDRDDEDESEHCDDDDDEHFALHVKYSNGDEVILGMAKFDSEDDCCRPVAVRHSTWGMVKAAYR